MVYTGGAAIIIKSAFFAARKMCVRVHGYIDQPVFSENVVVIPRCLP